MNESGHISYNSENAKNAPLNFHIKKKQLLTWGGIALFFLVYSGGSYYILFARNPKLVQRVPAVYQTPYSATATPDPSKQLPTPTVIVQATPSATPTIEGWQTYTNNTYKLRFSYPPTLTLSFNTKSSSADPYEMRLTDNTASPAAYLLVNVQDIQYIGQSDIESRNIVQLGLQEYAVSKWTQNQGFTDTNVPNRIIGNIETMTFLSKPAYSFTITGSWNDDRTYTRLSEKYTYLFTENKGYKIIISYPTANEELQKVSETISFF